MLPPPPPPPLANFLDWLGDDARYRALSQSALVAFAALIVAGATVPRIDAWLSRRRGTLVFAFGALAVLFTARWPTLFVRHRLNPDEAQMTAQAITAFHDPIPWLGFDGGTSGPLNTYVLMLPVLFGAHVTFLSTRIIAILLEWGAVMALYAALRRLFGANVARLATLGPVAFWAATQLEDFAHYSSEHLSIFLSSLALALLAGARARAYPARAVFAVGVLLGALPLAKLQSAALVEFFGALVAAALLLSRALQVRVKLQRLAAFGAGAVLVPALVLGGVALSGAFADFWKSYIVTALAYSLGDNMPVSFLTQSAEFGGYFDWLVAVAGFGAVAFALRFKAMPLDLRVGFAGAAVVFAGALDAIFSPHHGSPHYLLFGLLPAAGLAAAGIAALFRALPATGAARPLRGALAIVFVAGTLTVTGALGRSHETWLGFDLYDYRRGGEEDPIAGAIETRLRPGERLAMWGWVPEYWVYSDTLLGTRDSVTAFQYQRDFNPCREYFRARYIADFERTKPAGFLDAGPESFDFDGGFRSGFETFPELAAIVRSEYVEAASWKRFRFYVRRDRMQAADLSRTSG